MDVLKKWVAKHWRKLPQEKAVTVWNELTGHPIGIQGSRGSVTMTYGALWNARSHIKNIF